MANKVKLKRGATSGYASMLSGATSVEGEPHWVSDTHQLYVATGTTASKWVGAEILDENNMASDSDTKLATQQSIKKYVDDQVDTADTIAELGDTTIASIANAQVMVFDDDGGGSDDTWKNVTISSDATITNAGVLTIAADAITNAKLANITRGSIKVGGGSDAPTDLVAKTDGQILIGDGTDVASVAVSGDATITNAGVVTVTGAAAFDLDGNVDSSTQASTWTLIDNNAAALSFDASGKAGVLKLVSTNSSEKVTMSGDCEIAGDITVTGDMTVSGDTTTTLAQTVIVEDPMVRLATGNAADTNDIGLYGKYVATGTKYAGIYRDRDVTGDPWTFFDALTSEPPATGDVVGPGANGFNYAPLRCADITGSGATSGNGTLSGFDIDGGTW